MAEPSVDKLKKAIKEILKGADLDNLSTKKVRKMLEEKFKADFSERKKEIDKLVMKMIDEDDETGEEKTKKKDTKEEAAKKKDSKEEESKKKNSKKEQIKKKESKEEKGEKKDSKEEESKKKTSKEKESKRTDSVEKEDDHNGVGSGGASDAESGDEVCIV
ncbi:hypothetical protein BsWGS_04113 [Bradybaena similaris]